MPLWNEENALKVLDGIIKDYNLPLAPPTLLRFGENATYKINGSDIVVRIGRPHSDPTRQNIALSVASFLNQQGFSTVVPHPLCNKSALFYKEHHFTLWELVKTQNIKSFDWKSYGALLAAFHKIMRSFPEPKSLPENTVISYLNEKLDFIQKKKLFSKEDLLFFERETKKAQEIWQTFLSSQEKTIIHGDAHAGNVLLSSKGDYIFSDYDYVSLGASTWDLVPTYVQHKRLGLSKEGYNAFCTGYGITAKTKEHIKTLTPIRELMMLLWPCQNKNLSKQVKEQIDLRLNCLKNKDTETKWIVF